MMLLQRAVALGVALGYNAWVLGAETPASTSASSSAASEALGSSASPVFIKDAASRVNLFVGTTNGGHVFPG